MRSALRALMSAVICGQLWLAPVALAVIETYEFSFPDLEVRYHQLSQELRCPKCQNQNIADSNAPIARDLRVVLYEQLEQGATDDEILAYMVACPRAIADIGGCRSAISFQAAPRSRC